MRAARATAPVTTSERSAAVIRAGSLSSSRSESNATKRRITSSRPTPATMATAAVRRVSTASGMTAGQACDPGLTDSTPTIAHSGRSSSHRMAGPAIATAAATRASSQAWREAPCQISAAK